MYGAGIASYFRTLVRLKSRVATHIMFDGTAPDETFKHAGCSELLYGNYNDIPSVVPNGKLFQ